MGTGRKIFAGVFVFLAGIMFYTAAVVSALSLSGTHSISSFKHAMVAGFVGAGLVPLLIGSAITKFRYWKTYTGHAFVWSAGFTLLVAFTLYCASFDENFMRILKQSSTSDVNVTTMFNDVMYFAMVVTAMLVVGCSLLWSHYKVRRNA